VNEYNRRQLALKSFWNAVINKNIGLNGSSNEQNTMISTDDKTKECGLEDENAFQCVGCGIYFFAETRRKKHCSAECATDNPVGSDIRPILASASQVRPCLVSPAIKNGKIARTTSWKDIRKHILDIDDYVCRICFKDTAQVKLHVHHIEWDRSFNEDKDLVTLCSVCHKGVHDEVYRPSSEVDPTRPTPWTICR